MPLCTPLRYPAFFNETGGNEGVSVIGSLRFEGVFALAGSGFGEAGVPDGSFRLLKCGSRRSLTLRWYDNGTNLPLISSRGAVWDAIGPVACKKRSSGLGCTRRYYIGGLYLRGLREFTASLPTRPTVHNGPGEVVGLTERTIYAEAPDGSLWAAALPAPKPARRR